MPSAALSAASDREREARHLALMLHDHVQQPLVAARMQVHAAATAGALGGAAAVTAALDQADAQIGDALVATGYVCDALSPTVLNDLGLVGGLQALKARIEADGGLTVHIDGLDPEAVAMVDGGMRALLLYRVAEAALGAFARTGLKGPAQLVLWRFGAAGIALQVRCAQPMAGPVPLPLQALRSWAQDLHGDVRVRGDRRAGTHVTATLDLAADAHAQAHAAAPDVDLLQLFYQLPVGVVRMAPDGRIAMMNPAAARLLLPLAHPRALDNLIEALGTAWPTLRAQLDAWPDDPGHRLAHRCRGGNPRIGGAVAVAVHRGPGGGWLALLQPVRP